MSGHVIPADAGIPGQDVSTGLAGTPDQVRGDELKGSS